MAVVPKVSFSLDADTLAKVRAAMPDSGKPRLAPQWRYRPREVLVFDPPCEVDGEHELLPCAVVAQFDGYTDIERTEHYTAGGCYLVQFPCGCEKNVFEHWLKRDDGERTAIQ